MPWTIDKDIFMLKGDLCSSGATTYNIIPADERGKDKLGVFALPFALRYKNEFLQEGRKILIIDCALGGTGFCTGHWTKDGALYNKMLDMIDKALALNSENKVIAMLWHQGETDVWRLKDKYTDKEFFDYYYNNIFSLVQGTREKVGAVPFICAGFTNDFYNNDPRCIVAELAYERVVKDVKNAEFCQGNDLMSINQVFGKKDEDVHFTKESLYILGNRYYDAYKKLRKTKGEELWNL